MLTEAVGSPSTVSSASSWLCATSTSRVLGLCLPSKELCRVPELPGYSKELTDPTSSWWDTGMMQGTSSVQDTAWKLLSFILGPCWRALC